MYRLKSLLRASILDNKLVTDVVVLIGTMLFLLSVHL